VNLGAVVKKKKMDGEAGGKKSETHELRGGQHVLRKGFDFQLKTDF